MVNITGDTLTVNQWKLIYWIKERESIRKRKLAGWDKPWSKDKVFHETYFCNVNREDDKVTKWIRDNWLYEGDYKPFYTFAMIVARIFNLPSTLESVSQPLELIHWLEHAEEELLIKKSNKENIWNGAYIISTNGKKIDKLTYCLQILEKAGKQHKIIDNCKTLAEAHRELMKVEGLASFLAAQVVADLKNTEDHHLNKAEDWFTFSAPGPGSLRGLSWFWERKMGTKDYDSAILDAYHLIEWHLPDEILDILCMQNLQNCFCEYDKYMRVSNGTGRSKRKYNGV